MSSSQGGRHRLRRQHTTNTRLALGAALTGAALAITGQSVYLGPTSAHLSDTREIAEFHVRAGLGAAQDAKQQDAKRSASEQRKFRASVRSAYAKESSVAADRQDGAAASGAGEDSSSNDSGSGSTGSGDQYTVDPAPGAGTSTPSEPAPPSEPATGN